MTLYHLTSAHLIANIRKAGLNKGVLPWNLDEHGRPELVRGYQWLTTNAEFIQPWCLLGNLPYARNAIRITVHVPATHEGRLGRWLDLCNKYRPACADEINATGGDVGNWWVYRGAIPPDWFVAIETNLQERVRPESFNLG